MQTLDDLTDGIVTQINAVVAAMVVAAPAADWDQIALLVQDAHDIENTIDEKIGQIGMLALVNMPGFKNKTPLSDTINGDIAMVIEVGESPAVWRNDPLTRPKAMTVAQTFARSLQGLFIPGFQPLRVQSGDFQRDKKRQIYTVAVETTQVFDDFPGLPAIPVPAVVTGGLAKLAFWDETTNAIRYLYIDDNDVKVRDA